MQALKQPKVYLIGFMLSISFLLACEMKPIISQNVSVTNEKWYYKQALDTTFVIDDISQKYDVFFDLRHSNQYKYQNIYILFKMYPEGQVAPKTATRYQFPIAKEDGAWLGSGSGAIYSLKYLLKKQVSFPKKGTYHIYIEQNMRDNPLEAIADIGFSVSKTK